MSIIEKQIGTPCETPLVWERPYKKGLVLRKQVVMSVWD